MDFQYSEKTQDLINQVRDFIDNEVVPAEHTYHEQLEKNPWETPPVLDELKEKARAKGLWNLFLPKEHGEWSVGLSNLEYAPLAEQMGRHHIASECFNCSAPDTGNMEVLAKYGNAQQQEQWLKPLMEGKIRSAFAMTEPEVASSDATNIETSIKRDGDDYVINGRKFYISGAMRKSCEIMIVMGKTDPDNPNRHEQQSQILVPTNTPGVNVKRPMHVLGSADAPEGHAEVIFENVRVPKENIILGEGRGFEIAQGRLGPGRIHHCMRLIGAAQRSLELMCKRVNDRVVFGQPMIKQGSVREDIAKSYCEIEQARLLTLKAADMMDRHGNKEAKELIAMIKIVAPNMALNVIDRAIQIHGAVGLSQDTPLAGFFAYARTLRLADGPDQVHMMQLGRNLAKQYA
ncbi:acyl-CoA dehydrogenase family protein [Alloalcanivorax profundimaris]|uniref:acyl-CoA dehydrogenase family protein n=1 Tax=Alloalcanivorax profundimaris TaxID=2735259 RepID=UPI000C567985|nr:acyl-CoA dehydrogenase family protein [Alloalcanivorax profundimaris]MAO59183.1 acyl-CoA dehydrogenase [Alcanivorax sp.]MBM1142864.1 acyl-CoA dehydrogenase family protein [Alcanivorax sp. ZXX171]MCQ6262949.1 acyl-CoA dehydrogenase family protein [Alcanivorax sp. MM125-6]UWN51697.1 Acryloyl-CoA reductase (NADH) [Alcanivorax sp. ALC70]MAY11630.1 acyl-CoA dehydrogenase [Alcanivorax sp.]|tara:strand:- start:32464 stop:33672 length:1209 start_codon:yes stop_codon:yes gene_type:complete